MLLLSQGLVVSMRDLLDRTGCDLRVTRHASCPAAAAAHARRRRAARRASRALPSVRSALVAAIRRRDASNAATGRRSQRPSQGVSGSDGAITPPWTMLARARRCAAPARSSINENDRRGASASSRAARSRCARRASSEREALPPVHASRSPASPSSRSTVTSERRGRRHARRARRGVRRQRRRRGRPDPGDLGRRRRRRRPRPFAPRCPDLTRAHQRRSRSAGSSRRRLHLLPPDLDGAHDGHAVVRGAAHHGAADRLGEPAARRDRGAARARLLALRGSSPTCSANRR